MSRKPWKILLGFEVGTGEPVLMTTAHTVVTGMTQESGKTTTLEAIITRSERRAIAFKTKRGESGFNDFHEIPPFFREKSDWRYVASILEATMRERMKFERSWIMKASRNAKTLKDVYTNVINLKEKARKDSLSESVYITLEEYLKIVIPQIEATEWSKSLKLEDGVNVMDLTDLSIEMRSLVIRSVMEHIGERMKNVILVVPEAWEYLPQGRNTPVKIFAESFIRKGASVGNFLFVDSQDIAGIDKTPLRSCNNWILGRQKESYEVGRLRDIIGKKKVSEEDVRKLPLGHFYASLGNDLKKVYVLPAGVPESMGRSVALGEISPEVVKDYLLKMRSGDDEEMYRQKYEEAIEKIGKLEDELEEKQGGDIVGLRLDLETARTELKDSQKAHNSVLNKLGKVESEREKRIGEIWDLKQKITELQKQVLKSNSLTIAIEDYIQDTIGDAMKGIEKTPGKEVSESLDVSVSHEVSSLDVTLVRKRLEVETTTTRGQIIYLYSIGAFKGRVSVAETNRLLINQGWNKSPRTKEYMDEMLKWGFFSPVKQGRRYDYKVVITPEDAKEKGLLKFSEKVID